MRIKESLETKVLKNCDVLVCGGGFGGISAALSAARQGKKVILTEKLFVLGGLGTAGIVTIYLPLCDGMGKQVSFGIVEELLRLSISMGAEAKYPENWLDQNDPAKRTEKDPRFEVRYNPHLFAILAEQLLIKEGVEILYGTYAVAAHTEKGKIDAVICENKSGRFGISAKSVVDATGDADIALFSGAPTEKFGQGNVLAAWYYSVGDKGYQLRMLGASDIPDEDKNGKESKPLIDLRFSGLDGEELSRQTILSHGQILSDIKARRAGGEDILPVNIATTPQIRMTRRIAGEYTLDTKEMHTYFEDSIGMVSNWKKRGPVYEVPFRTLYSKEVKNLIFAGRCTSVTDAMWDIMRVIPCCAVTGQAAGLAAAMTDDFSTLDLKELQKKLKAAGVVLHEKEL